MTVLHAHSDPQFTERLPSVLTEANGQPNTPPGSLAASETLQALASQESEWTGRELVLRLELLWERYRLNP